MEDWRFVLLVKSQWRFPLALQILSVTGFPGLSFLLMLSNVALLCCGRPVCRHAQDVPGYFRS
jgi:apolipoprotein N-acyltransferase